jgi:hypothetical protein
VDDIEAIRQLKARYFRTMDTKDWAGMRKVFTDDVVLDTTEAGGSVVSGADEFMVFLQEVLRTTATGIWALNDIVIWPDGTRLVGYGHYHETYEKVAEDWKIKSSTLTRLHMDIYPPDNG